MWRTDRRTEFSSLYRVCITCSAVINRQDVNTHCEPMKATSNQNASPWTCPDCCISNVSGMMTSCRSASDAVVKSMVYFCDCDMHTRMSNVSCTVHLHLSSVSGFHRPGTKYTVIGAYCWTIPSQFVPFCVLLFPTKCHATSAIRDRHLVNKNLLKTIIKTRMKHNTPQIQSTQLNWRISQWQLCWNFSFHSLITVLLTLLICCPLCCSDH